MNKKQIVVFIVAMVLLAGLAAIKLYDHEMIASWFLQLDSESLSAAYSYFARTIKLSLSDFVLDIIDRYAYFLMGVIIVIMVWMLYMLRTKINLYNIRPALKNDGGLDDHRKE